MYKNMLKENKVSELIDFLKAKEGLLKVERSEDGYIQLKLREDVKGDLSEQPYFYGLEIKVTEEKFYNKDYGDNRICECGDSYGKHFDSWDNNYACGCKYCNCTEFVEKK